MWHGIFGMAREEQFTIMGPAINYTTVLMNTFQAFRVNTFTALVPGLFYTELCVGAQVYIGYDNLLQT